MSWTDCHNDECQIHFSEKQGSGWYPQFTNRSRKPSITHDHDWRQEIEANPAEDWVPQQPQQRRARWAHRDITSWEHCFNDNYKQPLMGKGGRRLLPQIGGRRSDTVEERQEGKQQKRRREDTA